jgi:hypothetical protein
MCWMMLGIRRFMLVSLSVVMIQSGITTGQQQQSNNAGFVHPIATETFPVNRPTAEAAPQQPAEEIPTSTEPAQVVHMQLNNCLNPCERKAEVHFLTSNLRPY